MLFVVDLCCSYNPKANLLLDWSVVHGIKKGSFFAIPFAILCLQPLATITRNLMFCCSDKK